MTQAAQGIPHTRGGEPQWDSDVPDRNVVFPTHVGVNRSSRSYLRRPIRIPHTRGGEPIAYEAALEADTYSPHTWG